MLKRGQSAAETMIIFSAVLLTLIAVLAINQDTIRAYTSKFRVDSVNTALTDMINGAESVYQQGVGAKTRVFVNFPAGIANVSINDKIIRFRLVNNNIIDAQTGFNVTGNITVTEGSRWLAIVSENDLVNITDG